MKDFGARFRHLLGFGVGNRAQAVGAGNDAGIAGEHAVDVGPDLDFVGAESGTHNGGGVIGTAAPESGGHAVFGGADEAAHHGDLLARNLAAEQGVGFDEQRRGLGMAVIGDDRMARVQMNGVDSSLAECGRDDDARKAFAEAQNGVGKPRRERTGFRNFGQNLVEFVEDSR